MNKDAKIIGVWGGRGSGKTTRVKELSGHESRIIAFDPVCEFNRYGFTAYKTFNGLYKSLKSKWAGNFKLSIDVSHASAEPHILLNKLCEDLFVIQKPYFEGRDKRKITLIVEEMSLSAPNEKNKKGHDGFKRMINLGRHYGVNIIGSSQRPAQVMTDFRGNCAEHYFFRPNDHNDVTAIKALIGNDKIDQLMSLKPHRFLHWKGLKNIKPGKNTSNYVK